MSDSACVCFAPGAHVKWIDSLDIGTTDRYWEVTRMRCAHCGTLWVRAFLEYEAFSRSGRHYRAPTTDQAIGGVTAEDALHVIELAPFKIAGGSRFDGQERIVTGAENLLESP